MRSLFVVVLSAGLLACGLAAPATGAPVNPTTARARFEVRAHATDVVPVDVTFPADADGQPKAGRFPALIYVQGGGVSVARYRWLGQALAERGLIVAMPEHPNALAFFAWDDALAALDLLERPPAGSALDGHVDPTRAAVGGHSLGGVVAAKLAPSRRFDAFVVHASFSDPADAAALAALSGVPSLTVAAERDCQATLPDVQRGFERVPAPAALAIVAGATHFQFTDSQSEDERRGCAPQLSLEAAHTAFAELTARFLDGVWTDGGVDERTLAGFAQVVRK